MLIGMAVCILDSPGYVLTQPRITPLFKSIKPRKKPLFREFSEALVGSNVATCHVKARKQNETSGIIKREIPIRADKVQLYCSTCKKGVRVGFKLDGDKKVRVCKKCGKEI